MRPALASGQRWGSVDTACIDDSQHLKVAWLKTLNSGQIPHRTQRLMTGFSQIQRPPIKGELAFQEFCLKLVRRYWNDDKAELYARRGQSQYGIDIRGQDKRNNHLNAAMQCKGSETNGPRELTEAEVEDEVSKARELTPKLNSLIIAYAGPRSGPLQDKAKALHDENIAAGLFEVALWSWDDVVDRTENFPDIAQLSRTGTPAIGPVYPQ